MKQDNEALARRHLWWVGQKLRRAAAALEDGAVPGWKAVAELQQVVASLAWATPGLIDAVQIKEESKEAVTVVSSPRARLKEPQDEVA